MARAVGIFASLIITATACVSVAGAQAPSHTLRGVARDSVSDIPLAGAFVVLQGTSHGVLSDSAGRFVFDSLVAGTYTVVAQHAALDTIGLSGIRRTVSVPGPEIVVSTPSFATLWRVACGDRPAPSDSGFVYGTVRASESGRPMEGAYVALSWVDLRQTGAKAVDQTEWGAHARTGSSGTFAICGIPLDAALELRASSDSGTTGGIEVLARRALRIDFAIATSPSAARGFVVGVVTDSSGAPIAGVRAMVDGAEVRSDATGRFVLREVTGGTRQVQMVAVGRAPVSATVEVVPGDTAFVTATMFGVQQLDPIRVVARTPYVQMLTLGIEERKRTGTGFFMDSTRIATHGTLVGALRLAPSLRIKGFGARHEILFPARVQRSADGEDLCHATVWIDGRKSEQSFVLELRPDDIAVVEVYPRFMLIPAAYTAQYEGCGVVAIWTKRAFR